MARTASCSCGNVQIALAGEPARVLVCNCLSCQKRTGSVFGVSAYFGDDQVIAKKGDVKVFVDTNDQGRTFTRSFCLNCGSTVFWHAEFMPDAVGVAVGCFEDPAFPEPSLAAWCRSKHDWVAFPDHWPTSQTQDFSQDA